MANLQCQKILLHTVHTVHPWVAFFLRVCISLQTCQLKPRLMQFLNQARTQSSTDFVLVDQCWSTEVLSYGIHMAIVPKRSKVHKYVIPVACWLEAGSTLWPRKVDLLRDVSVQSNGPALAVSGSWGGASSDPAQSLSWIRRFLPCFRTRFPNISSCYKLLRTRRDLDCHGGGHSRCFVRGWEAKVDLECQFKLQGRTENCRRAWDPYEIHMRCISMCMSSTNNVFYIIFTWYVTQSTKAVSQAEQ